MGAEDGEASRAFEVRPARLTECAAIAALIARVLPADAWSAPQLSSEIALPEGRVWAASEGGALVGCLVARRELDALHVLLIGVAPERRRSGIAGRLLTALIAGEHGLAEAYLEVREANAGAQAFYRALGFGVAGRRPRHYASGEAAVLMTRSLAPRG
ncbi:MAG: GNAT family N-acetyltransferase [Deltaproteobacteria bacterium]|nr:GNAT family N-acetyltransferase [Deltaproteobacteria bacterium]